MEFTGKFSGFTQDVVSGETKISFTVEHDRQVLNSINDIKGLDKLRIKAVRYRKKRSLDANAYYWVLVTKMAEALKVSKPFMHNHLLRKYGQTEMFDGKIAYIMLPDTRETEKRIDEMEECHFAPTSQTKRGKDDITYRAYRLLKGSHTYDTKEMSELIDGTVSEAKELGIETLPPDELERMVNSWHPKS